MNPLNKPSAEEMQSTHNGVEALMHQRDSEVDAAANLLMVAYERMGGFALGTNQPEVRASTEVIEQAAKPENLETTHPELLENEALRAAHAALEKALAPTEESPQVEDNESYYEDLENTRGAAHV